MRASLRVGRLLVAAATLTSVLVPVLTRPAAAVAGSLACQTSTDPPTSSSNAAGSLTVTGHATRTTTALSLTGTAMTYSLGPELLQPLADGQLIVDGTLMPTSVTLTIVAGDTTQPSEVLDAVANTTIHIVNGQVQPLMESLALPNSLWQLISATAPSAIAVQSVAFDIVPISGLMMHAIYTCQPTAAMLIARFGSLQATPASLAFGAERVGTFGDPKTVTVTNHNPFSITILGLGLTGAAPDDFFGTSTCTARGRRVVLAPGGSCRIIAFFSPIKRGVRRAALVLTTDGGSRSIAMSGTGTEGFFLAGAQGEVGNFGDAVYHGDAASINLTAPIISLATTPNGAGYWLLGRDGGIFSFGNAHFYGSTGAMHLNKPIVAMAASGDGRGYRLVGSDGGIFAFGDAHFYGSTGGIHLNKPIAGMAATVDDRGYWLVASDGGIFAFGDARFHGSAANVHLTSRVIQIAPTPSGRGYWILTGDGHLYPYGDARSYGTAVGQPTIGMAVTPDGRGYWEATRNGRVFNYGDATSYGDISNLGVDDVIGIAPTAPALPPELLPFAATAARLGSAVPFTRAVHGR